MHSRPFFISKRQEPQCHVIKGVHEYRHATTYVKQICRIFMVSRTRPQKIFSGYINKQLSLEDCFVKMYRFVLDPSITRPYSLAAPQGVDATVFDN